MWVVRILQLINLKYGFIWIIIRLVGGALVRFVCLLQADFKALIDYSLLAHIRIALEGLLTIQICEYVFMFLHSLPLIFKILKSDSCLL